MFNKELFLSLCEKYNVEFSKEVTSPMIKDAIGTHAITRDDVLRIMGITTDADSKQ